MSQNSDVKYIFAATECPSVELLMMYNQQKLDRENLRNVELHLADCEICSDMVEGLLHANTLENLNQSVAEITNQIQHKISQKKSNPFSISQTTYYSIAASILVLLGVSFLLIYLLGETKEDKLVTLPKPLPQLNEKEPIQSNPKLNNTDSLSTESNKINSLTNKENPKKEMNRTEKVRHSESLVSTNSTKDSRGIDANLTSGKATFETTTFQAEDLVKDSELDETKSISDLKKVSNTESGSHDNTISIQSVPSSVNTEKFIYKTLEPAVKNKQLKGDNTDLILLENGKIAFSKSNYFDAKENLSKFIYTNPENEEALYFLARSERMLKNYNNSNQYFNKLLLNKNSTFFEESEWQTALNLIDDKKDQEALLLLKKIASGKGKYAYAAAELLGEIGD